MFLQSWFHVAKNLLCDRRQLTSLVSSPFIFNISIMHHPSNHPGKKPSNFFLLVTYLFSAYLLSTYYVSDTVLVAEVQEGKTKCMFLKGSQPNEGDIHLNRWSQHNMLSAMGQRHVGSVGAQKPPTKPRSQRRLLRQVIHELSLEGWARQVKKHEKDVQSEGISWAKDQGWEIVPFFRENCLYRLGHR